MDIDEAIHQLERGTAQNRSTKNQLLREAMKLGIEALKAVKDARANNYYTPIAPLPGETEGGD